MALSCSSGAFPILRECLCPFRADSRRIPAVVQPKWPSSWLLNSMSKSILRFVGKVTAATSAATMCSVWIRFELFSRTSVLVGS